MRIWFFDWTPHGLREPPGGAISNILRGWDLRNVHDLASRTSEIRSLILAGELPPAFADEIVDAYQHLSVEAGAPNVDVAVSSSATAEDLPDASFAGQQA